MSASLINAILLLILEAAIIRFGNHEPSDSMDILSEKRLFENLLSNYTNEKNRTIILVSHRMSQLKDIERIIVLENGQFTEKGTHQELLQNEKKRMCEAYINL